jgi:hypothetical protein
VVHGHSLRVASDTLRNSSCDLETGKRAANIFSGLAAQFFRNDGLPCEADDLASVVLSLSARERNTSLAPTVPAKVYRSRTGILEDFDENSEETREDQEDRLITEYVASMIPPRRQEDEWLPEKDEKPLRPQSTEDTWVAWRLKRLRQGLSRSKLTSAPETPAPDTSAPDTSAPDTSAPDTATQAARDPDLPEGREWRAGYDKREGTFPEGTRQNRVPPYAASKRWSGSSRAMFSPKSQS